MSNNKIFVEKLKSAGLRPTKQRMLICKVLFDRKDTFHFTVKDLIKILEKKILKKISVATVYNTVNALKEKAYLKEILVDSEKNYFDTNISNHHHFYNENTKELIDLHDNDIRKINIKKTLPGKKIKSIEVLVKVANSN